MAALPPLPAATGVFPQFVCHQTTTLVLREKVMSLSGDDFHIKDTNGQSIFRIQGKVMSLSGRKEVFDANNQHLFTIRKEHLTLLKKYYAEDPSGKVILNVNAKFGLGSRKFEISFVDSTSGQQLTLDMKGDFFHTSAEIKLGALVVARIDRKLLSGKDIFMGQQTYALTVAPGMDMASAVAMCVCLDEARNDK